MDTFQAAIQWVLNLGSAVFVPIIILILGLVARMKFKRAFTSALTLGIAFTGMNLVIGFMTEAVGPASEALANNTGISLPAIDVGWTGAASITWSWVYAFTFFAIQIAINILMLSFNWTKTLNVDMWNVWGKAFTAYFVYFVSGHLWAGFLVGIIQIILELKLGDMFQRHIEDLTGIPLVTVTHPMSLTAAILVPINKIMDYIPFLNKQYDANSLKQKIGVFSENSVMGFVIGLGLGFLGAYAISDSLNLAVQVAAAMTLFPMISKLFMQSLSPLADAMSDYMKNRFQDREIYIGMDWPILAGRAEVWVTLILLVPVFIGFALILPGNKVLPIAGVLNYGLAISGLLLTGANVVRMLILGVIFTPLFLYASSYLAPMLTDLAKATGAVDVPANRMITWSSMETPEFRLSFAQAFAGNWIGILCAIVFIGLFIWLYKEMTTVKVPSERYASLENDSDGK
ncbi:PTS transporter subunit IIC [Aerococcus urinae]|uniref:PTS galactitol transporter subunit IIC n=1 Tax=Aerococcus urinae TaxID=1376 RepID=UPI00254A70ED|nr:PTS transporter subunit IIC [Aerococcus urinae]MDK6371095.1 PTS transporter subunit IIC [Aerococcus urinae]